ncbi:MAG: hypothetical protein Q7S52_04485 [bacterium]|nr:hypothetical protein [bacterium]
MKKLFVLLFVFLALPALAAVDTNERESLCASVVGKMWFPSTDRKLYGYAEEFSQRAKLAVSQIVICESDNPNGLLAGTKMLEHNSGNVLVIGVGRGFAQAMEKHLRAIVAHEVAHHVTKSSRACADYLVLPLLIFRLSCEQDTDRVAADWVGRDAMLAALKETVDYFLIEMVDGPGLGELEKRIQQLERLP